MNILKLFACSLLASVSSFDNFSISSSSSITSSSSVSQTGSPSPSATSTVSSFDHLVTSTKIATFPEFSSVTPKKTDLNAASKRKTIGPTPIRTRSHTVSHTRISSKTPTQSRTSKYKSKSKTKSRNLR